MHIKYTIDRKLHPLQIKNIRGLFSKLFGGIREFKKNTLPSILLLKSLCFSDLYQAMLHLGNAVKCIVVPPCSAPLSTSGTPI